MVFFFFFRLASFPKERELMQLHCQCEMKLELHFITLTFLKVVCFFFFSSQKPASTVDSSAVLYSS